MGRMQREKGKRFERQIAAELRAIWPDAVVRRASQAERADNPDVFIEGGPPILSRLWLELQDARVPTPRLKLEQAEADVWRWQAERRIERAHRLPVVVWHRIHGTVIYVTTRLWVTTTLAMYCPTRIPDLEITMSLDAFVQLLQYRARMDADAAATTASYCPPPHRQPDPSHSAGEA